MCFPEIRQKIMGHGLNLWHIRNKERHVDLVFQHGSEREVYEILNKSSNKTNFYDFLQTSPIY